MWFRIAENGSVNGDAAASPFTAVSPLCHRGEFQHGESPFTAVTPPKRKTSPVITGHLITGYHAVMVTSFSALISTEQYKLIAQLVSGESPIRA